MSLVQNFYLVRIGACILAATLVIVCVPLAALAQTSADASTTRSSSDRGVTIKVTLKSLGSIDNRWEFIVVLDTHSADISDDLAQSATLTTNDGRTLKPLGWAATAADGHHREGVLAFDKPAPLPSAIELRIKRKGESVPRLFRWNL